MFAKYEGHPLHAASSPLTKPDWPLSIRDVNMLILPSLRRSLVHGCQVGNADFDHLYTIKNIGNGATAYSVSWELALHTIKRELSYWI